MEKISRKKAIAGLEDPVNKYPKTPFNDQSQPWPGLASKMDPVPDHGEKTYKGLGRLMGRKALITGGDSGMPTEVLPPDKYTAQQVETDNPS